MIRHKEDPWLPGSESADRAKPLRFLLDATCGKTETAADGGYGECIHRENGILNTRQTCGESGSDSLYKVAKQSRDLLRRHESPTLINPSVFLTPAQDTDMSFTGVIFDLGVS